MTDTPAIPPADWAAALLAVDPGLGGILLRARACLAREAWIAAALALSGHASRRLPVDAGEDRIFGGLDLAATLAAGRPVHAAGLLADMGRGTLVVPMAERMTVGLAARLGQAMDAGARFALVALDEGEEDQVPPAIADRLAFAVALAPSPLRDRAVPLSGFDAAECALARDALARVQVPDDLSEALTGAAAAFGIGSLRAPLLALRCARAAAALRGKAEAGVAEAELAAALVLAPRARRLPEAETEEPPAETPPPPEPSQQDQDESEGRSQPLEIPEELLLEAVKAAIPPDLLSRLAAAGALSRGSNAQGAGAGDDQRSKTRGRPAGTRRGDPRSGGRLDLVATLRAAAPWQPLRRGMAGTAPGRVIVTPDDFRIRQFNEKREKVVIFAVDASGSAAMTRLAETKGAIELMLAEAYVRREQVALIAFRGETAELLLPPTRSLVQAKRRLSALPGGGGTPLAAGIEAAALLADRLRRRGQMPHVALLTDGRANIARDGTPGRETARNDALAAARMLRAAGTPALLLDTSPRPQDAAKALAAAMGALYLPMPRADARTLDATLRAALTPVPGAA
ncbi:magnesium chelatase subunit D [Halovulum dunhuangense]|uniref:Magnesium chelatase subunit D n=1 Tax=Halovulum dunhuangense TaxID=1505036 RepID=A0A849KYL9_9RHOB|nr:magnesium chelatase subunit D [Halovulum dunhuangense]